MPCPATALRILLSRHPLQVELDASAAADMDLEDDDFEGEEDAASGEPVAACQRSASRAAAVLASLCLSSLALTMRVPVQQTLALPCTLSATQTMRQGTLLAAVLLAPLPAAAAPRCAGSARR